MSYRKLHTRIEPDQSAVIPYRVNEGRIEVLLITTRKRGRWIVPKGSIESSLTSHASAASEALEEAGVMGRVSPVSIGCYRHGDGESDPIVEIFLMRVERENRLWLEQDERERQWVSPDEAFLRIDEDGLKSILDDAIALIRLSVAGEDGAKAEDAHPAVPEESTREESGGS